MDYVLYTHYLQMVYVVFSYMFRSQLVDHLQGVYVAVTITGSVGVCKVKIVFTFVSSFYR
jgi:hypothetical protein